jgi:hypothetical protein
MQLKNWVHFFRGGAVESLPTETELNFCPEFGFCQHFRFDSCFNRRESREGSTTKFRTAPIQRSWGTYVPTAPTRHIKTHGTYIQQICSLVHSKQKEKTLIFLRFSRWIINYRKCFLTFDLFNIKSQIKELKKRVTRLGECSPIGACNL